MKFLTNLFTGSDNMIMNAVFSLVLVLAMILLIAWVIKFFSRTRGPISMTSNRRLSIIESVAVDSRRKLVLVRHGEREHLIMIGGSQDLVVEANIKPTANGRANSRQAAQRPPQPDTQNGQNGDGREVWRETPRRRQFASPKNPMRKIHQDQQVRQERQANLATRAGEPPRLKKPTLTTEEEWHDQQSEITQLQDELAENKNSLQQLQSKRYHPGMRTENTNEPANPNAPAQPRKVRPNAETPEIAARRRTMPTKSKPGAKLKIAIQENTAAKNAPYDNDSDTVSPKRAPQSVKRPKSGAKKTVSRRKPASPPPTK